MDALIAGVPRSGTTLLSNLMHCPKEGRIMLNEPLSGSNGAFKKRALDELRKAGINARSLREMKTGQMWGIKEVLSARYYAALSLHRPKVIIFVVRDLIDSMNSYYQLTSSNGDLEGWALQVESRRAPIQPYRVGYIGYFMEFFDLIEAIGIEHYVVKYEDMISGEEYRNKLSETLKWPLNGDPFHNFKALNRNAEIRDGIKARAKTPLHPLAIKAAQANKNYQSRFGYKRS